MTVQPGWWISWYTTKDLAEFEMHSPWWVSGYSFDPDSTIVVAAVRAADEDAAYEYARSCFDNYPQDDDEFIERFCEPLDGRPAFTSRFPKAAWMEWTEDGKTCNCCER